ncbi:hypothetical protein MTAT_20040 [Moorella thermoacetica]|uniref:Uncharacterized protein n=1 Tax=Neomoorella thermoacetica TaxID=1525 RepID=A0AAC9MVE5_NEOTH|nr:hypothetical protein [Moorella thermoacetica]AOQ24659.1 hypothetical protein Maut_02231 [Moorella thermoacetica]TYL12762.1 hypothetical protein MTAT_20040 [Moorella thermoacetica]
MSIDYWPIVGFGVEVTEDIIDKAKLKDKNLEDILEEIATGDIYWAPLGEMSDEYSCFLYIPAALPWENRHKNLTEDKVKKMILDALRPYLRPGVEKDLLESIGYISEVGCG